MFVGNFWPTTLYSCSRAEMCVMLQTGSLVAEAASCTSRQRGRQVFLYHLTAVHFWLLAGRCWNVQPVVTELLRPDTQQHVYVFVLHLGHCNPAINYYRHSLKTMSFHFQPHLCPLSVSSARARVASQ